MSEAGRKLHTPQKATGGINNPMKTNKPNYPRPALTIEFCDSLCPHQQPRVVPSHMKTSNARRICKQLFRLGVQLRWSLNE